MFNNPSAWTVLFSFFFFTLTTVGWLVPYASFEMHRIQGHIHTFSTLTHTHTLHILHRASPAQTIMLFNIVCTDNYLYKRLK